MGSYSSLLNNYSLDIYLSFSEENEIISDLKTKLINLNYNICDSYLIKKSLETMNTLELSNHMNTLIENTKCIIVCLSLNSVKSYTQCIEMNKLLDNSSKFNNKVIYLIIDNNYPSSLINIIQNNNNTYFPYYNVETFDDSFNKIIEFYNLL